MPDALQKAYGYHIYFWSNEGDPSFCLEPVHIHFSKTPHKNATKYWILSDGTLRQDNNNDSIPDNDLKRLIRYASLSKNIERAKAKWIEHFGEISYIQ